MSRAFSPFLHGIAGFEFASSPLRLDGIRAPFEVHNILQPSMLCASDAFASVHALRPGECAGLASVASADETFARSA